MDAREDFKRTTLRLPQDLYDQLETLARDHQRSLNAEIISILRGHTRPLFLDLNGDPPTQEELVAKGLKFDLLINTISSFLADVRD
ncbi:Arc family DNA-binding protein [Pseudogemmobacter bohemicus]|uniref:Arc family DNA-binding protein n=1 Tax=Pseudogemmobacter bohemicus TaxID=2250708 RepID=UPI000DD2EC92|nr:Arc family DNA-binding protein [Pseudogemmobacter bohemicus]